MIEDIQQRLVDFAAKRDWEQFQSPKNLAMALSVEAAELLEHFQWMSEQESQQVDSDKLRAVAHELADIFMYTLLTARRMNIDLQEAVEEKMAINESRYPSDLVKGSAKKYSEY